MADDKEPKVLNPFEENDTQVLLNIIRTLGEKFAVHRHDGRDSLIVRTPSTNPVIKTITGTNINAAEGDIFEITAAGNTTLTISSPLYDGHLVLIRYTASGANRTLTLSTGFRFGTTIASLSATTQDKTDYIECIYDETDDYFDVVRYVKGF